MSDAVSGKAIVKALNGKADVHEAVGNISAAGELRAWAARIERGDFSITSPAEGEWKAISEVVQRENAQLHDEVRRLRAALEQLIEDYERRLRSAITVIDDPNTSNEQRIRVYGKKEAYRTFIHELQALSTTEQTCCQNPDVQTFGPNEVIKNPTNVCVNCGKLLDIEQSDERLRAALEDIRDHAVRIGLATVHLKAEQALYTTTEPTGAQRITLRPEVQWFAQQMEAKLRENDHKGGWGNESLLWLYTRMIEEAEEVKAEIKAAFDREIDYNKIIREAADVANFAMMIADNARRINAPEGEGNDA